MNAEELAAIRAAHQVTTPDPIDTDPDVPADRCIDCGEPWPCDVVRVLDALQELGKTLHAIIEHNARRAEKAEAETQEAFRKGERAIVSMLGRAEKAEAERDALRVEYERVVAALEFYADRENWAEDTWGVAAIINPPDYGDPGFTARAVLAGLVPSDAEPETPDPWDGALFMSDAEPEQT